MSITSKELVSKKRLGSWMPRSESALEKFRNQLSSHVKKHRKDVVLFPVVRELSELIHSDPVIRMYFTQAIEEALACGKNLGYTTIDELIGLINGVMTYAPPFDTTDLVGCPLNALLDWPMCTPSGFALFRMSKLNEQFKKVLNFWCSFLSGPSSREYLNEESPDGWFCPESIEKTHMFQFRCDPSKQYWGFSSWNDFFTRRFKEGQRPVAEPGNNKVIVSACEATPYKIQQDVKLTDTFWIKEQPYSLQDIFTRSRRDLAKLFVGGSIYQAFLSAYNYHRWHAPVSGTVVDAYLVDGTYYSDATSEGLDPAGPNDSQGYITAVAARSVMVIRCDAPELKHVACVFVGMAEISSCVMERIIGEHVNKGDELGYFQYGGSTHCLIFEPGVIRNFMHYPSNNHDAPPVHLNSPVAIAN